MFRNIGTTEIIIIAVLILILFGGKKIPEFFKGLGESISEFKRASKDNGDKAFFPKFLYDDCIALL